MTNEAGSEKTQDEAGQKNPVTGQDTWGQGWAGEWAAILAARKAREVGDQRR